MNEETAGGFFYNKEDFENGLFNVQEATVVALLYLKYVFPPNIVHLNLMPIFE
jgi:hypothetical protein